MKSEQKKIQAQLTKMGTFVCRFLGRTHFWVSCAFIFFAVGAVVCSPSSFARIQDPTSISATRSKGRHHSTQQKFVTYGAELNIETSTGLNTEENANYQGQYNGSLGASFPIYNLSMIAGFGRTQEYSYENEYNQSGDWTDPNLKLIKNFPLKAAWIDSFSVSGSGTYGLNKRSELATYKGSLGGSVSAQKTFLGKLTLRQGAGYTRNFFEYDIQDNGAVNSPNTYSLSTSMSFSFFKSWSSGVAFSHLYSVSYQNVGKSKQIFNFFTSYNVTEYFAITGGLATLRGTLEPDGQTNSIKLIEPNSTSAYINLGLSI